MLGRIPWWRHLAVVLVLGLATGLAVAGKLGASREESFDSKQITIWPVGDDGLRIREVVDEDFGTEERHGYQRTIPEDFGEPTDIEASSTDAPDDVDVDSAYGETRIRIGDPDETITGQHRYVLEYTLPTTGIASGVLALDVIGTDETLETARFEVIVLGLELDDVRCNVGWFGDAGGCDLERDGDVYRAVFEPLEAGDGITIGGTVTGRVEIEDVADPPLPDRHLDLRWIMAGLVTVLGAAAAGGVFWWARRRGRNEVFSGGAVEAAFGTRPGTALPPPGAPALVPPAAGAAAGVQLVADDRMDELATIEFVPPRGIDPWQGSVVLRESFDDETVAAWFSAAAARGLIDMTPDGKKLRISVGPARASADVDGDAILTTMFAGRSEVTLGSYDPSFAAAWKAVAARQQEVLGASGWWKGKPPKRGGGGGGIALVVLLVWVLIVGGGSFTPKIIDTIRSPWIGLPVAVALVAITALFSYKFMLRARTAEGSAVALRTESFRRFLAASEGKHVDWAWQHGLLREYSAWAVALGCADAWGRALQTSHVPPQESMRMTSPMLMATMAPSIRSAHTAPSKGSSGGGFSGGFSGGSVGGGGGGGSSGSW